MMRILKWLVLLGPVSLVLSCSSDYPGYDMTDTGLYYQFHIQNEDAAKPAVGDIITVNMIYRLGDSVLFNSKEMGEEFRFPLDPPGFGGDIFEGLAMMHVGDSATFIVSADSLQDRYGNLPPLDSGTMLYFDVRMLKFQSKAEFVREKTGLEKKLIADYIRDSNITVAPTATGLYLVPLKKGSGAPAEKGQVVEIHYNVAFLTGEKLFSTRESSGSSIYFELGKNFEIPAIEEALKTMNPGSSMRLVVPSALAYGEEGLQEVIPPYSPLIFDLELISISEVADFKKNMEKREKQEIIDYLKEHNITQAPDPSGLYYIEETRGTGPRATPGTRVIVNYQAMFLNGDVFETSKELGPVTFTIGNNEVIRGWELGITHMNAGGKALLIIPSALGYGETYAGVVPPYTPLVYEIELVSVK